MALVMSKQELGCVKFLLGLIVNLIVRCQLVTLLRSTSQVIRAVQNCYWAILHMIKCFIEPTKARRLLCTFSLRPRVGITSLSQSGPGADARPKLIALPSISCSVTQTIYPKTLTPIGHFLVHGICGNRVLKYL